MTTNTGDKGRSLYGLQAIAELGRRFANTEVVNNSSKTVLSAAAGAAASAASLNPLAAPAASTAASLAHDNNPSVREFARQATGIAGATVVETMGPAFVHLAHMALDKFSEKK